MTNPLDPDAVAREHSGPKLRIVATCFDCTHERSESYAVQGDSGHKVYCDHPEQPGRHIGDTTWDMPAWCPLYAAALEAFLPTKGGQP